MTTSLGGHSVLAIKIIAIVIGLLVATAVVGVALVVAGSPGVCAARQVQVGTQYSQALQGKWSQFKAQAGTGPAEVTFTEAEITSRGREYLQQEGVAVDNLVVHLCQEGYAQATGVYTGAPVAVDMLAQGTLDLSGPSPRLDVQKIQAGSLPGFLSTAVLANVLSEESKTLRLSVKLKAVSFGDGQIVVTGGP